jgi:hypothetical protein
MALPPKGRKAPFSPAREGGVGRLHVTGTLIPALTGGAESRRLRPSVVL